MAYRLQELRRRKWIDWFFKLIQIRARLHSALDWDSNLKWAIKVSFGKSQKKTLAICYLKVCKIENTHAAEDAHGTCVVLISQVLREDEPTKAKANFTLSDCSAPISIYTEKGLQSSSWIFDFSRTVKKPNVADTTLHSTTIHFAAFHIRESG